MVVFNYCEANLFQYLFCLPQGWVLHCSLFMLSPIQKLPPFFASVAMVRLLVLTPPPQEAEQELQSDHSPHAQLTAKFNKKALVVEIQGKLVLLNHTYVD